MAEELDLLHLPVIFEVRNDKDRGLLIESLKAPDSDVYLFKRDDQPLRRHCEQMQIIVRKANVLRSKKLKVDLSEFIHEYYRSADKSIVFRATKLKSVTQQIEKVHEMTINKELGVMKRKSTLAQNKAAKIAEKQEKILAKIKENEEKFQAERKKRIDEFKRAQGEYGSDQVPTSKGNGSNGSSGSGHKFVRNVVGQQSLVRSNRPSCYDNNLQLPAHINIQQFGNRFNHVNHLLQTSHGSHGKFLNFLAHENRLIHSFDNYVTSQQHNNFENFIDESSDESQSGAKEMNPQDVSLPPDDEVLENNSSDEMEE